MEKTKAPVRGRGGRPPKTDTAKNCVMVRFTDGEYARFLALFELLYKLESETRELVAVGTKIAALAEEFRQRW